MIDLFNCKQNCCGCTACANICPQKAIEMSEDSEGFKYPSIDIEKCTMCNLCKKVCAFQNGYDISGSLETPLAYAVKHTDENIRMSSSSGGAFTSISDFFLENGGVVYGVQFNENMDVVHGRALTKEERDKFRGSKYVQSDLSDIYVQVADDLLNERLVLFTGTPCQCAGLKSYLNTRKISRNKLLLCDLVCHGTPSPKLWRDFIKLSEKRNKSKVKAYYCRSKILGWHKHTEMAVFENNKSDYQSHFSQVHKFIFYTNNALRPACYNCKYTNLHRCSDITIADFWSIEKSMPDFDDNTGISLVLINSPFGKKVFNEIKYDLEYRKSSVEYCLQPQLQYPTQSPTNREVFWYDYYSKGFLFIAKKYTRFGYKLRIKHFLYKILKKIKLCN